MRSARAHISSSPTPHAHQIAALVFADHGSAGKRRRAGAPLRLFGVRLMLPAGAMPGDS
jgi:hypothetical protein